MGIQRGALMVEMQLPDGKRLAILNVHTTSGVEVIESGVGKRMDGQRDNPIGLDQLLEVLTVFEKFSTTADHKVFCGDFNLPKESAAFKLLEGRANSLGLQDCFPTSPPTFGCPDDPIETLLTKPADMNKPRALDHVFSNKACVDVHIEKMEAPAEQRNVFQQVSDHRA